MPRERRSSVRASDPPESAQPPRSNDPTQRLQPTQRPHSTYDGSPLVLQAESAARDEARVQIVAQDSFSTGRGVALKNGAASREASPDADSGPDLIFTVRCASAGRCVLRTHAAVDAKGAEVMRRARTKFDSLHCRLAVGGRRPTRRVVFVPWSAPESCTQTAGKFTLEAGEQEIGVWLPAGVRLDWLEIAPYEPPAVPAAAAEYRPRIVPPKSRPRIWMNRDTLPWVRGNLQRGDHAPLWEQIRRQAAQPVSFAVEPGAEVGYDAELEKAAVARAFVHLMEGGDAPGREAVALMKEYLSAVEFGNILDITREIGRAIYSGALVYDWCYDLMSLQDREVFLHHFLRLAEDMEIGWPPFRQMIVNGHGNEAQLNRDLLCMAIAVYDEDPAPYQYCAYRVLEELVPMRRFEYQSPRHNQGVSYGPYRFAWELHAAWLFYRMSGQRVFDENLCAVARSWLYQRLPNGQTLRDGDGFSDGRPAHLGATSLLAGAYARDPFLKYEFQRQGGVPGDPLLVLLVDDPDLEAAPGLADLPHTCDFGPVLGSMVARTGWTMGTACPDVVVEMKGGGYQFGGHQHADAGSFQIYYHGFQVADLGQYHFYGTPYDYSFCKRSVSHSMMLALDPDERFPQGTANDGGARFLRRCPLTPEETRQDPAFANGTVLAADFGPSRRHPLYSYFSVDLTSAYGEKIRRYVRTFVFLDLKSGDVPAALIVLDDMTTARASVRKYWQINTLQPPERTAEGVVLNNRDMDRAGRVHVRMLRPRPEERTLQILSGADTHDVFGTRVTPPRPERPEAHGHRIMFSPREQRTRDIFLTVLLMAEEGAAAPSVDLTEEPAAFVLRMAGRVVTLDRTSQPGAPQVQVELPRYRHSVSRSTGRRRWSTCADTGPGRSRETSCCTAPAESCGPSA